jgi:hypothetical protein
MYLKNIHFYYWNKIKNILLNVLDINFSDPLTKKYTFLENDNQIQGIFKIYQIKTDQQKKLKE